MIVQAEIPRILRRLRAAIAAVAILSVTTAAMAGDVADKAAEAENLLQSGEPAAAFGAIDAAVDAFWTTAPLTIEDAYFVTEDGGNPSSPRPDAAFASAERVGIQLAPLGYGFAEDNGKFRIALSSDVEIRTPGGLILAKSDNFARLEWTGPGKNRAFSGRITVDMPSLKAGEYEFVLTLTDLASKKSASVTLPFEVLAE